ncbi:3-keto-disaccharide hydrolase [Rubritalea sp.]|uniref:3-keto-disaccharide hydrolase n=1 Tax=Rubritalea sp. TaxID=2109375 RepID=UPI003EFA8A87
MKALLCIALTLAASHFLSAASSDNAKEPTLDDSKDVKLIAENSFEGWEVPSELWTIKDGVITGDTAGKKLKEPEWIYTKKKFRDFIFSADVRLSGGPKSNSGIYFRVKRFDFKWRGSTYDAPSGYEYDAGLDSRHNGSLGDWYARPSLRVFADSELMKKVFKPEDWNRMTIRAEGDHIEYWLNGTKVLDYIDKDPKRSPEGIIGLQMHDKLVMKVEMRKAVILTLNE